MKNRPTSLLVLLTISLTTLAQATQPCIVKQYNQKHQKTPLPGVQVEVRDAGSATSNKAGLFTLKFATLKPGDRVPFRAATKTGFELMNKMAVEQWNIARDQKTFEIVLVKSDYFNQLKNNLKQASIDSYHQKYEQTRRQLEKQQKEGKLKEQEYFQKLSELEDRYDNQLKNLDSYIDQFARIDLSELSEQEQQFIELAHAGRLDEAAEAYNRLDAANKYTTAVENIHQLTRDIEKLENEKAQLQETANSLYAMLQRQVATLKLAGGEENFRKAGELLKRAALADTTDIVAVWEYASFAQDQQDFKEAERFYLISLNGSKDNPYQQAAFQNNLGLLYHVFNEYVKAEKCFLKALENNTQLFSQNPDVYRADLANIQNNLGLLYRDLHNYAKAEEYYVMAQENFTLLFNQNPDTYRNDLAGNQNCLGNLYNHLNEYAKAKDYYLKALENCTQLFRQNHDAYHAAVLAGTQNNLGNLYIKLHDYARAEDFYLHALENRTLLFNQNPDAYRADLASTQNNLGFLYYILNGYTKAEEYYLKALENRTQLFSQNPDAYRAHLAMTQNNLGTLYSDLHGYNKAEGFHLKALENYTLLFSQNPDVYRAYLASAQNNLGLLYKDLKEYIKAEKYHIQALENYTILFSQAPDAYREDLAMTQNNLGILYKNRKDYAKAKEYYNQAFENYTLLFNLNPDAYRTYLASALNNLGALYDNLHEYAKAEEYYLKALENYTQLFSQNPDAYHSDLALIQKNLGEVYEETKDDVKAEEYYLQAIQNYYELYKKQPDKYRAKLAWIQYSLIYVYARDTSKSEQYDMMLSNALANYTIIYKEGNKDKPILVDLKNRKGLLYLAKGKNDEAIQLFEDAYKLSPEKSKPYLAAGYNSKAYEYAKASNYGKAIETIDKAITLMPEEANFYDTKGEILLMKGDTQGALEMWHKVLELNPQYIEQMGENSNLFKQLKEKCLIDN